MTLEERFKKAVVVGTGMMGPGIALTLARGGVEARIAGRTPESVERGMNNFNAMLKLLAENDLITGEEARGIRDRVTGTTAIFEDAAEADIVVESITEDLKIKQDFFRRMEKVCSATAVLATNTSGLRITDISAHFEHPERAVTTHFWNPPALLPLVEVIGGERTAPETTRAVYDLLKRCGKSPVLLKKDVLGQMGNRLLHAVTREAAYMVQEGICTAEDIDTAMKNGPGLRYPVYGPLDHADIVGLDMLTAIQTYLAPDLCNHPGALPILQEKVASGDLGAKTGRGFYDWSKRDANEVKRIRDEFIIWCLQRRK